MIHLLNGSKEIRQRNSENCTVLACGCAHTDTTWLQMCDADYTETEALRAHAREEHRLQALAREFT